MKKVLIAEDSAPIRNFIAAIVRELGALVVEAENGGEALRKLPGASFDLMITDINMPDFNGLELVAFVKRSPAHRNTPIVIVTTEGAEKDRQKGMDLGASAYLSKPFTPDALRQIIRPWLQESHE